MKIPDGTYLFQKGQFIPIHMADGYWVAEKSVPLAEIQDGMVVGSWTDTKTGQVYLDKVRLVRNLTKATMYATLWQQIAIWDNANKREVRIG